MLRNGEIMDAIKGGTVLWKAESEIMLGRVTVCLLYYVRSYIYVLLFRMWQRFAIFFLQLNLHIWQHWHVFLHPTSKYRF